MCHPTGLSRWQEPGLTTSSLPNLSRPKTPPCPVARLLVRIAEVDEAFDAIEGTLQHGYPITYEAAGRQFIAVPASLGSAFRSLTAQLTPEIYQPEGGNAIYVFALPQERPGERRQDAAPATPRCRTAALLFCEGKGERDPVLRADRP